MDTQSNIDWTIMPLCYFFSQNQIYPLVILKNQYDISIKNNFAEIKTIQTYNNPFNKPLEIHYSIPTDPIFCLTRLTVYYQQVIVEGVIKEKELVKVQYKEAQSKGQTVMVASFSKNQKSVLKIKIGNIEPKQQIRIQFDLIGQLNSQIANSWTLRIPSHISPRYINQIDLINALFKKFLSTKKDVQGCIVNTSVQWDFKINLKTSQPILKWNSGNHNLKENKISDIEYQFQLNQAKVPQKDLQFTFYYQNQSVFCTVGDQCACVTFYPSATTKSNFEHYASDYIFVLDRSGSMAGSRIEQALLALSLFLKSLPSKSTYNIISFGSKFERLYKNSIPYTNENIKQTLKTLKQFIADFGGTQIQAPLIDILEKDGIITNFQRNIIVLTDGQVSNSQGVINIIRQIKEKNIAKTHMVGIGNGISFQMIRNGSIAGGGQHLFIMKDQQMKKQIIYLLESITSSLIKQFNLQYNNQLIKNSYPLIPNILKRCKQNNFYLRFNAPISHEEISKELLKISYFDEETNQFVKKQLQLKNVAYVKNLMKYSAHKQIENLLDKNTEEEKKQAMRKSLQYQVLCRLTAYICRIKQIASIKSQQAYLLKLRGSLQGESILYNNKSTIFIKTLTGKSIQIKTNLNISVCQLKDIVQQIQGIPNCQQRYVYLGKSMEDSRMLQDYGIGDYSTIHMVLRLRDGGGSSGGSSSSFIIICIGNKTIRLANLFLTQKIQVLIKKIQQLYPKIPRKMIKLQNKGIILDTTKTLNDYNIINQNRSINVIISKYLLNSQNIIEEMTIQGFWQYNQQILKDLDLLNQYQANLQIYQGKKNHAMTVCILNYLKTTYPNQLNELKLIYNKIEKFLANQSIDFL